MNLVQKIQVFIFLTAMVLGGFLSLGLGNISSVNVQAQDCRSDPAFAELNRSISACGYTTPPTESGGGKSGRGVEQYTNYTKYQRCVDKCPATVAEEGGDKRDIINCAEKCTDSANLDQLYFTCVDNAMTEAKKTSPNIEKCLCESDQVWLEKNPASCRWVIPRYTPSQSDTDYLANFLPSCSLEVSQSEEGLVACLRSIVKLGFTTGIGIFFVSMAYIVIRSRFNNSGNFWAEAKRSISGLIIGILFIGMPTVILELINPDMLIIGLGTIKEFNMKAELLSPFRTSTPKCDGDPGGGDGGVVYDLLLETGENIKFPQVAIYNCEVHVVTTGEGSYHHWYLPIFDSESMVDTGSLFGFGGSKNGIDHSRVVVSASENNGLVVAAANDKRGIYATRLWEEDKWGTENALKSGAEFMNPAIIPYKDGWAGVVVDYQDDRNIFYSAKISKDAKTAESFNMFDPPVVINKWVDMSYHRNFSVGTNPDHSITMFASGSGNNMYLYKFNGTTFSDQEHIVSQKGFCWYPNVDIADDGTIYFACYGYATGMAVFEGTKGNWQAEEIATADQGYPSLSIDEEGGVHLAWGHKDLHYWYKPPGGSWSEQVVVPNQGWEFIANLHGQGYAGEVPYMAVVFEDWRGGAKPHLYLLSADA